MTLIFYDPSALTVKQVEEVSKVAKTAVFIPVTLPVGTTVRDVVNSVYIHDKTDNPGSEVSK